MKAIWKGILQGIVWCLFMIILGAVTKTTVNLFNIGWNLLP